MKQIILDGEYHISLSLCFAATSFGETSHNSLPFEGKSSDETNNHTDIMSYASFYFRFGHGAASTMG